MSLTFPLAASKFIDILSIQEVRFFRVRQDQLSRTAGGQFIPYQRVDPYWRAEITTARTSLSRAAGQEAVMEAIGANQFYVYNPKMPYPAADPFGASIFGASPAVLSISTNRRQMALSGLPSAYILTAGDLLRIDSSNGAQTLHRIVEGKTASGPGSTAQFEITPPLPSFVSTGRPVILAKPSIKMALDHSAFRPGTGIGLTDSGMSFAAVETA